MWEMRPRPSTRSGFMTGLDNPPGFLRRDGDITPYLWMGRVRYPERTGGARFERRWLSCFFGGGLDRNRNHNRNLSLSPGIRI
jgi:hypothetical protein